MQSYNLRERLEKEPTAPINTGTSSLNWDLKQFLPAGVKSFHAASGKEHLMIHSRTLPTSLRQPHLEQDQSMQKHKKVFGQTSDCDEFCPETWQCPISEEMDTEPATEPELSGAVRQSSGRLQRKRRIPARDC